MTATRNKQSATKARFEARRFAPYPKRKKNTPAEFDLLGNPLNALCGTPARPGSRIFKKLSKKTWRPANLKRAAQAAKEQRRLARKQPSAEEFLAELQNREKLQPIHARYRAIQLDLLRRYGAEPTWFGIGERTPRELAIANRRQKQLLLTKGNYDLKLSPEYGDAEAEVINIAATFSLGITHIDNRHFLLARDGIRGHLDIRHFLASRVYLTLEHFGKVNAIRMFESGQVSITGAKSEAEALAAAHLFVRYLRDHGVECHMLDFEIVNVVLVFDLHHYVDIIRMSTDFPRSNLAKYIRASRLPRDAPSRMAGKPFRNPETAVPAPPAAQPHPRAPAPGEPNEERALVSISQSLGLRTAKHWSDDPRDFSYTEPEVGKNGKFAAVVVHIDKIENASGICLKPPAISLSAQGKGVCCGASSIEHAKHAMERAIRIFRRYRTTEKFSALKIRSAFDSGSADVVDVRGMLAHVAATYALEKDEARGLFGAGGDGYESGSHPGTPRTASAGKAPLSPNDAENEEAENERECLAAMLESGAAETIMGACIGDLFMFELNEDGVAGVSLGNDVVELEQSEDEED